MSLNGGDPDGGDDMGGSSPDELSETLKALICAIDAVPDKESITPVALQKFCFLLGQDFGLDQFRPYSIYLWGPYSKAVDNHLCKMEQAQLIRTRPSQHHRVNADVYELTEKGETVLVKIDNKSAFTEAYNLFKTKLGKSGSWEQYDRIIYGWLSQESNYVGIDPQLMECLEKKAAYGEADRILEETLASPNPAFLTRFDGEVAKLAKLAFTLQKSKCEAGIEGTRHDYDTRYSVRKIYTRLESDDSNTDGKIVLLRGFAQSIHYKDRIFNLKEDSLEDSPSIRVEFFGEWSETSHEILHDYSIGILGYTSTSSGEPTIKALAVLKGAKLPEELRNSTGLSSNNDSKPSVGQASLLDFDSEKRESHSVSKSTEQSSLSEFEDELQNALNRLEEAEDKFHENHSGNISKQSETQKSIDALFDAYTRADDLESVDRDKLKSYFQKAITTLESGVSKAIKIDFLIEVARWIGEHVNVSF